MSELHYTLMSTKVQMPPLWDFQEVLGLSMHSLASRQSISMSTKTKLVVILISRVSKVLMNDRSTCFESPFCLNECAHSHMASELVSMRQYVLFPLCLIVY